MTSNQIKYWDLQERKRSNKVNEAETHRSNVARETETNRHNTVTEAETERHNRALEGLTLKQVTELQRHNQATEVQAVAELQEKHRSNVEQEHIGQLNVGLGYARLGEEARHNRVAEENTLFSVLETQRSHRQNEAYTAEQLEETRRSNREREEQNRLNWLTEVGRTSEQGRHNVTTEGQTKWYNEESIKHSYFNTIVQGVSRGATAVLK